LRPTADIGLSKTVGSHDDAFVGPLFLAARLHAYLVLGLASSTGIIFYAGLVLVATCFAGVRLLGLCGSIGSIKSGQHQQAYGNNFHVDFSRYSKREDVSVA
jgi:hypothetical protein